MSISGRVAVVTGAGRGIGRGIALQLAKDGAAVAVWDLDPAGAEETVALVAHDGGRAIACVGDASEQEDIARSLAQTRAGFGPVSILVNNAAVADVCSFPEIEPDTLDRILRINLRGPFICTQAVIPDLLEQGWGRIVNISSSSAQGGAKRMAHYAASKGGLIGLTKALAMEYVDKGITVNHIPPSFIDTPMSGRSPEETKALAAVAPMRRAGRPEDVAAACSYLVSDAASYVTGQTISVNGGRYLY